VQVTSEAWEAQDMDYAVLMMAYGGPNSLDDVEPYLLDVRGGRTTPPELVGEVRERYARIGGRSPLLEITRAQAEALERCLNGLTPGAREPEHGERGSGPPEARVYVGMRHWYPYIGEAVMRMAQDGVRRAVALCMAPHYSRMSIGAYFQRLQEAKEALGNELKVAYVESWHDHPLLVKAIAERVEAALERFPSEIRDQVVVIFTAHSLPAALAEQGDPYDAQVQETARLVAERLGLAPAGAGPAGETQTRPYRFSYQSAGARNVKWLGPAIEDVVAELAEAGQKNILVAPVGFVADHVEILYDIDIVCRDLAGARGARLERTESLNTSPTFIGALADIVRSAKETWNTSEM
jgi:protoporphyrin/coproporphyrin ferrochelatase